MAGPAWLAGALLALAAGALPAAAAADLPPPCRLTDLGVGPPVPEFPAPAPGAVPVARPPATPPRRRVPGSVGLLSPPASGGARLLITNLAYLNRGLATFRPPDGSPFTRITNSVPGLIDTIGVGANAGDPAAIMAGRILEIAQGTPPVPTVFAKDLSFAGPVSLPIEWIDGWGRFNRLLQLKATSVALPISNDPIPLDVWRDDVNIRTLVLYFAAVTPPENVKSPPEGLGIYGYPAHDHLLSGGKFRVPPNGSLYYAGKASPMASWLDEGDIATGTFKLSGSGHTMHLCDPETLQPYPWVGQSPAFRLLYGRLGGDVIFSPLYIPVLCGFADWAYAVGAHCMNPRDSRDPVYEYLSGGIFNYPPPSEYSGLSVESGRVNHNDDFLPMSMQWLNDLLNPKPNFTAPIYHISADLVLDRSPSPGLVVSASSGGLDILRQGAGERTPGLSLAYSEDEIFRVPLANAGELSPNELLEEIQSRYLQFKGGASLKPTFQLQSATSLTERDWEPLSGDGIVRAGMSLSAPGEHEGEDLILGEDGKPVARLHRDENGKVIGVEVRVRSFYTVPLDPGARQEGYFRVAMPEGVDEQLPPPPLETKKAAG